LDERIFVCAALDSSKSTRAFHARLLLDNSSFAHKLRLIAASEVCSKFSLVTIFAHVCGLEHEFLLASGLFLTAIRIIGFIRCL
jgi:hypothetical protein